MAAAYFETIVAESTRSTEEYLKRIAKTFPDHEVKCTVEKGKAEDVIIEKAGSDATLTAMATHGRSGFNRLLLGSVAEKVLRSSINPLLLIRASEETKSEGQAILRSVIVPLDGSELAEIVLSPVVQLANALKLEILLLRAYHIPVTLTREWRITTQSIMSGSASRSGTRRKVTSKAKLRS